MDKVIYVSYLLRVWRVVRDDELIWMASLEDPHTGRRQSFTSLEDVYAFLWKETRQINVQTDNKTNDVTKGEKP